MRLPRAGCFSVRSGFRNEPPAPGLCLAELPSPLALVRALSPDSPLTFCLALITQNTQRWSPAWKVMTPTRSHSDCTTLTAPSMGFFFFYFLHVSAL